ncbi:GAF domain-containing protein [Pedobacter westerhofensis]|uniref:GAF domain-containing protein n=1 Tax=Pedobacter westerhofensis TaxID=425512 RepID=A0A521C9P3_9SPHI|nr:GAF domain-containing protein [Pedobacter westerhofensis]SMO56116.1 GAF domain-containing protein [Pedobacter westerhofensis]
MKRYNTERLADVDRFLKLDISKDKELQEIVELAAEICGSPIAMITLMDGETQFVKFRTGADIDQVDYTNTFCQFTLKSDDLLIVPDATKDKRFADNVFVQGSPHLRFYAGMPLTTEKGNAVGTLCVFDTQIRDLPELEKEMLRSLAQQVTRLLEFDITHQILKEQYEQSLSSSNTLLAYFQSSSSCHLLMDENMRVVAFNQSISDLIFKNRQAYLKVGSDVKPYVHPEFLDEFVAYFNRALSGENISVERHLEYFKGKICWYVNFECAFDSRGQRIGVSLNATDITASVNNQERLKAQLQAIERINDLQVNELIRPIERININIKKLNLIPELAATEEFLVLYASLQELLEKQQLIASGADQVK